MTRIKNILVPVDFSDASKQALRYACELADTFEASLHVLYAAENLFVRSGYTEFYPLPQEFFDQIEQEARKQLEMLLTTEEQARYGAVLVYRTGAPAQEILDYVRAERHIDLIVMADPRPRRRRETHDGQRRRQGRARGPVPGPDAAVVRGVDRTDQSCGVTSGPRTPLGVLPRRRRHHVRSGEVEVQRAHAPFSNFGAA